MAVYPGEKFDEILIPRFTELYLVTAGYSRVDTRPPVVESIRIHMRDEEGITFGWRNVTLGKDITSRTGETVGVEIAGFFTIYDTSIPTYLNLLKLSQHPICLYAKNVQGHRLNFRDNPYGASIGFDIPPTWHERSNKGSLGVRYINNSLKRCIELEFRTKLTMQQFEWLVENVGAYNDTTREWGTGNVIGTPNDLTLETDTRDKYIPPGFELFLANDTNIGHFEDAEMIQETMGTDLNGGQKLHRMLKTTFTIKGKQDSLAQLAAVVTHGQNAGQWSFKAKDKNPDPAIWTFSPGTLGLDFDHNLGEQYGGTKFVLEGDIAFNTNWADPAHIDLRTPATPAFSLAYNGFV